MEKKMQANKENKEKNNLKFNKFSVFACSVRFRFSIFSHSSFHPQQITHLLLCNSSFGCCCCYLCFATLFSLLQLLLLLLLLLFFCIHFLFVSSLSTYYSFACRTNPRFLLLSFFLFFLFCHLYVSELETFMFYCQRLCISVGFYFCCCCFSVVFLKR